MSEYMGSVDAAGDGFPHGASGDDGAQALSQSWLQAMSGAKAGPQAEAGAPSAGASPPSVLAFLAPPAAATPGLATLAGGAGVGALAGGAVGGLLTGPQAELQAGFERANAWSRSQDYAAAHDQLAQLEPTNPKAAPDLSSPGWVPSEANVADMQDALAEARSRRAAGPNGGQAAAPARPDAGGLVADGSGAGNKLPPASVGSVRPDGGCDEDANVGATSPSRRLPSENGSWSDPSRPGNSAWTSTDPRITAITGKQPINFVNGRPDFTPWAKLSINLPVGALTGHDPTDQKTVRQALDQSGNPDVQAAGSARDYMETNDLTAHHATDTCMQLIPKDLNSLVPHIGSAADLRFQAKMGRVL